MGTAAVPTDFIVDRSLPSAAVHTWSAGGFEAKVAAARAELADCVACPRDCHVDRMADERAVCRIGRFARVASAFPHFGEEDCLRGRHGSGTIFFSSCNLRCVFCQNWDISQSGGGKAHTADELARLMLDLEALGCHNINLVTPEHVAPQVVEAVAVAVPLGLRRPIVYNTSGYDAFVSLQLMDGLVDVYMPDFKFWEPETARRLARARDYPEVARTAIAEMHRQVGDLVFDDRGIAVRGLLVRHLVMPGQEDEAAAIFRWLAEEISPDTYVNVMAQYRPQHRVNNGDRYRDIARRPRQGELNAALGAARSAGLWRFDR